MGLLGKFQGCGLRFLRLFPFTHRLINLRQQAVPFQRVDNETTPAAAQGDAFLQMGYGRFPLPPTLGHNPPSDISHSKNRQLWLVAGNSNLVRSFKESLALLQVALFCSQLGQRSQTTHCRHENMGWLTHLQHLLVPLNGLVWLP